MTVFLYALIAIVGYLFGCSNMAFYISKIKKVDIKNNGSKNYGASNTVALAGVKAGVLVFIHDALKSAIPVILTKMFFDDLKYADVMVGCFAIIGHIFPFYLKFDGGKGYASFIGMSIALHPVFGAIAFLVSIVIALISDLVVASTFSFIIAVPIYCLITHRYVEAIIIGAISVLLFIKHKENIKNIITRNGKEASIKAILFKKKKKENQNAIKEN